MGFLLTGLVLGLLALLMDRGPAYPLLWALGVEPAMFFRTLLYIALLLALCCPVYELLAMRRRQARSQQRRKRVYAKGSAADVRWTRVEVEQ